LKSTAGSPLLVRVIDLGEVPFAAAPTVAAADSVGAPAGCRLTGPVRR